MKVGDLVKRDVWRGCYTIVESYRNEYGGPRLKLLNLHTLQTVEDIRPSHVKVLK